MHSLVIAGILLLAGVDSPFYEAETIFPPEPFHNHSSSVVVTPQGDLLACWFHGHGERSDDTLVISGARKRKGEKEWSPPFLMADNRDLPDQNPVLFIDPRGTLWLFWISSLDNLVRSYLIQYRTSTDYTADGPPIYPFKTIIPIAGVFLLLQGIVEIVRCIICIRQGEWPSRDIDVEEVDVDKLKQMVHVKDEDIARLDELLVHKEAGK